MKNTLKLTILIFLTINIYIGLTRLLKIGLPNTEYNLKGRLREDYTSMDWGDEDKIEKVMAAGNDENDDDKDFQEKTRQLRKENQ